MDYIIIVHTYSSQIHYEIFPIIQTKMSVNYRISRRSVKKNKEKYLFPRRKRYFSLFFYYQFLKLLTKITISIPFQSNHALACNQFPPTPTYCMNQDTFPPSQVTNLSYTYISTPHIPPPPASFTKLSRAA